MLQTFYTIPNQIAGWPLFGWGLLLAVWAVVSVGLLAFLAWRQGFNRDTWSYVPLLLLLGAIISWVLPRIAKPEGLPIRGYGVMMLLAVVAGTLLAVRRGRRLGIDPDTIFSLAFWMVVPGIIGARAFYVIEYWPEYWRHYTGPDGSLGAFIGNMLNLAEGGLVVYGSFFGGVVGLLWFVRKHRLPLLAVLDLMAPCMMLGLALGRIGCVLNGCCFGAVCDHPWAITFPAGTPPDYTPPYRAQVDRGQMYGFSLSKDPDAPTRVLAVDPRSPAAQAGLKAGDRLQSINAMSVPTTGYAYAALEEAFFKEAPLDIQIKGRAKMSIPAVVPPKRSLPVHPTQIYSVIDAAILFLLLLIYAPWRRRDGELFALILTIYPITRFLIERLRSDEAAVFGTGLSISQNVSLLMLLCAIGLWFYVLHQPRGTWHREN